MCEIERRMLWRCRCYAVGEEEKRCANEKINAAFILGFFHIRDMLGILKTNKGYFVFV